MNQASGKPLRVVWRGPNGEKYERWIYPGETKIGRANDNDICLLYDARVSRHHAVIVLSGGTLSIRDLNSLNGTVVNSVRLGSESRALHDRDSIVVGTTHFTVRFDATGELPETPTPQQVNTAPLRTLAAEGFSLGDSGGGRVYSAGNIEVVELTGSFDVSNSQPLQDAFEEVLARSPRGLIIDLTQVSTMDSVGLGVFVRMHRLSQLTGTGLCIVGARAGVRAVFSVTGTSRIFLSAENVEKGLKLLRDTQS